MIEYAPFSLQTEITFPLLQCCAVQPITVCSISSGIKRQSIIQIRKENMNGEWIHTDMINKNYGAFPNKFSSAIARCANIERWEKSQNYTRTAQSSQVLDPINELVIWASLGALVCGLAVAARQSEINPSRSWHGKCFSSSFRKPQIWTFLFASHDLAANDWCWWPPVDLTSKHNIARNRFHSIWVKKLFFFFALSSLPQNEIRGSRFYLLCANSIWMC